MAKKVEHNKDLLNCMCKECKKTRRDLGRKTPPVAVPLRRDPVIKKKRNVGHNGGRKVIPIDWGVVDKCLISGSSGVQTAAFIGVSHETLYTRCRKEKGVDFSVYLLAQKQKGNSLLLGKQLQVALSGNTTMLVWLGKQRLNQTDQPLAKQEFNGSLANLLDVMHLIKSAEDFDALVELAKEKSAKEIKHVEV